MGLGEPKPNPCNEMTKMHLLNFQVISFSSGYVHFSCISDSNDWYALGYNHAQATNFSLVKLMDGIKFKSCYCGGDYTTAIDENGNVYGIGINSKNQLGRPGKIKEPEKLNTSHCGKMIFF